MPGLFLLIWSAAAAPPLCPRERWHGQRTPDRRLTMRAAAIDRFGGPEVITMHTLPMPKHNAQEVLIAVDTAGVGIWDLSQRDGRWAEKKKFPLVLGTDGSGVVAAVGSSVRRFRVGDRIYS